MKFLSHNNLMRSLDIEDNLEGLRPDTQTILGFYMGKNTPERKDYIMENLVVPVED